MWSSAIMLLQELCYQLLFQKQPPKVFYKKAATKMFAIFIEKHPCWSLFLISCRHTLATLLKRDSNPVNIAKFLRKPILKDICERLLLLFLHFLFFISLNRNLMEYPIKFYPLNLAVRRVWFILSNFLERYIEIAQYIIFYQVVFSRI